MCYVYILISNKDGKKYIGSTRDLYRRISQHNKGLVKSTKNRRPLVLYAYREFDSIKNASQFEKKYKRSHGMIIRDVNSGKITLA